MPLLHLPPPVTVHLPSALTQISFIRASTTSHSLSFSFFLVGPLLAFAPRFVSFFCFSCWFLLLFSVSSLAFWLSCRLFFCGSCFAGFLCPLPSCVVLVFAVCSCLFLLVWSRPCWGLFSGVLVFSLSALFLRGLGFLCSVRSVLGFWFCLVAVFLGFWKRSSAVGRTFGISGW